MISYACDPLLGSEPGAGWALLRLALDRADVTVITCRHHEPALREAAERDGLENLAVEGIEEPCARWWPLPGRILPTLAYVGWLYRVEKVLPRIVAAADPDVLWHTTYSMYWLPTPLRSERRVRTVWGPLGGAVESPPGLRALLRWPARIADWFGRSTVRALAALPMVARSHAVVDLVLAQNIETANRIRRRRTGAVERYNHAFWVRLPSPRLTVPQGDQVVWMSPMDARKAASLAIRALVHAPGVHLELIGDGPERHNLEREAVALGVSDRSRFLGRLPRAEAIGHLESAAAAIFTGISEEGGLTLGEALTTDVPVVVLDHGGPRTLVDMIGNEAGIVRVQPEGSVDDVARRLGSALTQLVTSRVRRDSTPSRPIGDRLMDHVLDGPAESQGTGGHDDVPPPLSPLSNHGRVPMARGERHHPHGLHLAELRSVISAAVAAVDATITADLYCGAQPYRDDLPGRVFGIDRDLSFGGADVVADVPLPFADDTFDLTTCFQALYLRDDDQRVVDELARVTRPGGIAIVTVPHLFRREGCPHEYRYRADELRGLFCEWSSCEILTIGSIGTGASYFVGSWMRGAAKRLPISAQTMGGLYRLNNAVGTLLNQGANRVGLGARLPATLLVVACR